MASSVLRRAVLSVTYQTIPRSTALRTLSTTSALSGIGEQMMAWPHDKVNKHFIDFLERPNLDCWELRQALTELHSTDMIPDPEVVTSCLRACRRLNDFSLCIRYLESLKIKCGTDVKVYKWLIAEIQPVLNELGISTPEELGYDKPEFFIPDPDFWWEKKWYKELGFHKKQGYEHFA